MTIKEFLAALKAQGVPREHFAMRCPICQTIQSATDLIHAGAGQSFADVEKFLGFSCVGRCTHTGPHKEGDAPGRGCDWSLGGLFHFHELEVVADDGKKYMRFALVSPEEAKAHMQRTGADAGG